MRQDRGLSNENCSEAGFTVTELLVVISVGSIVIGYCLAMVLFLLKFSISWQRQSAIDDMLDAGYWRIARDIERSSGVDSLNPEVCTIVSGARDTIRYQFDSQGIRRNGWPVSVDTLLKAAVRPGLGKERYFVHLRLLPAGKQREGLVVRRESSRSAFEEGMKRIGRP
jgi:prepilin-type N-terminal cleavage/methylation domain-containing protein